MTPLHIIVVCKNNNCAGAQVVHDLGSSTVLD